MRVPITMQQLGPDVESGVKVDWLKEIGDVVAKGDPLVEVETEKRKSFSPFKKSKKAAADVEEQQPVIKFGFKVSEGGEVTIDMQLEKAAVA